MEWEKFTDDIKILPGELVLGKFNTYPVFYKVGFIQERTFLIYDGYTVDWTLRFKELEKVKFLPDMILRLD